MSSALLPLILTLSALGAPARPDEPKPNGAAPAETAGPGTGPSRAPGPTTAPRSPIPVLQKPGRLTVELRDGESRKPAAGRARVVADGKSILPAGAPAAVDGYFLVDGSVRLEVPAGACRLQVDGGPTRLPYDAVLNVAPGGSEERTIYFVSPAQYAFGRAGWVSADPLYSAGTLPPEKAWTAARANDVAALALDDPELLAERPPRWARSLPVSGRRLEANPVLGSRCVLQAEAESFGFYADCARPRRINPWRTLVPWRPELREFYAPRTEATVGLAPRMYYELLSGRDVGGFEVDGSPAAERLWFALLNEGWRVPAVAGSRGSLSAGAMPEPRMLLRAPNGKADLAALVAAARGGRSTLSFGPFCFMAVDGKGPGEELPLAEGNRRVLIRALANTGRRAEISRIELWRNGRVLKSWTASSGQTVAEVELVAPLDEPGWMLAKCYQRIRPTDALVGGPAAAGAEPGAPDGPETVAFTNPLWIVPENYRISLEPVKTAIDCRIVDAASGKPLPAVVNTGAALPAGTPNGLVRKENSGTGTTFDCPTGVFVLELPAGACLSVSAPGYAERRVNLFDELGLPAFARRLAAMPPEEAVVELSSSKTFDALRKSMSRLELVVELHKVKAQRD